MVVWFSLIEAPLRPRRVRSAESGGGLGGLHSLGGMTTARAPPGLTCLGSTVKCILHQVNDRCFPNLDLANGLHLRVLVRDDAALLAEATSEEQDPVLWVPVPRGRVITSGPGG
jgi:hypothetical protein